MGRGKPVFQEIGVSRLSPFLTTPWWTHAAAPAGAAIIGDTGIAHLATAYRTPSVTLFGPISAARRDPPDRAYHHYVRALRRAYGARRPAAPAVPPPAAGYPSGMPRDTPGFRPAPRVAQLPLLFTPCASQMHPARPGRRAGSG